MIANDQLTSLFASGGGQEIALVPAPERLPVECWQPIQSGSERAFDFMAKFGIRGAIGGGSAEDGAVERHMLGFQAAYARRSIKLELRRTAGARLKVSKLVTPDAVPLVIVIYLYRSAWALHSSRTRASQFSYQPHVPPIATAP
jgi:hypothetical protein